MNEKQIIITHLALNQKEQNDMISGITTENAFDKIHSCTT